MRQGVRRSCQRVAEKIRPLSDSSHKPRSDLAPGQLVECSHAPQLGRVQQLGPPRVPAFPSSRGIETLRLSTQGRRMKVIYIAGTSHSGSTLLDLMLNAHPKIMSVGEVVNLHRQLTYKNPKKKTYRPCSCGAPSLWACQFWSSINERMLQTIGTSLLELDLLDHGKSSESDTALFAAISEVSGKDFIVDSSKLPSRLAQLMREFRTGGPSNTPYQKSERSDLFHDQEVWRLPKAHFPLRIRASSDPPHAAIGSPQRSPLRGSRAPAGADSQKHSFAARA